MLIETKQTIITKKVLNETTGELESKDFKQLKESKRIKGGFLLMYYKDFNYIQEHSITSAKDVALFNWITNKFTYIKSTTSLNYSDCTVNISKASFHKFIKKLIALRYLHRISRGEYLLNPFIYLPYKSDEAKLQEQWNTIVKASLNKSNLSH